MRFFVFLIGLMLPIGTLQGCANSSSQPQTAALTAPSVAQNSGAPLLVKTGYNLSGDESNYDCKKLTGVMQLRILEIRDEQQRNGSSAFSRFLQSAVAGVIGGSSEGTDPEGRYAKDVAMLKAYNTQLAAKACKTYDLNSELVPKELRDMPTANVSATSKN